MTWPAILLLGAGAYACKALGLVGGARAASIGRTERVLSLLPAALLAALVMVQTFDGGHRLVVDARAAGVATGTVLAWRKAPFVVVVSAAALVTAALRRW